MSLVISKIKMFITNNGKSKIIQSDNGKEFYNFEMKYPKSMGSGNYTQIKARIFSKT